MRAVAVLLVLLATAASSNEQETVSTEDGSGDESDGSGEESNVPAEEVTNTPEVATNVTDTPKVETNVTDSPKLATNVNNAPKVATTVTTAATVALAPILQSSLVIGTVMDVSEMETDLLDFETGLGDWSQKAMELLDLSNASDSRVTELKIPSKAGSVVLVPNLITLDETSVLSKTFAIDANSKLEIHFSLFVAGYNITDAEENRPSMKIEVEEQGSGSRLELLGLDRLPPTSLQQAAWKPYLFSIHNEEPRNLTVFVTLKRGGADGAAIAMDDLKVQWLPLLAREVAEGVQHQEQLFPPSTQKPASEEAVTEAKVPAAVVTKAPSVGTTVTTPAPAVNATTVAIPVIATVATAVNTTIAAAVNATVAAAVNATVATAVNVTVAPASNTTVTAAVNITVAAVTNAPVSAASNLTTSAAVNVTVTAAVNATDEAVPSNVTTESVSVNATTASVPENASIVSVTSSPLTNQTEVSGELQNVTEITVVNVTASVAQNITSQTNEPPPVTSNITTTTKVTLATTTTTTATTTTTTTSTTHGHVSVSNSSAIRAEDKSDNGSYGYTSEVVLICLVVVFGLMFVSMVFKYYQLKKNIGDYRLQQQTQQTYDNPAFNGFGMQDSYRSSR